jgi:hypothetical protein
MSKDYEENTINIQVKLSEDDPDSALITSSANLSDSMPDDAMEYYSSLVMGLNYMINFNAEMFVNVGELVKITVEAEEDEIVFEPDEELKDAIAQKKVINIKSRMN